MSVTGCFSTTFVAAIAHVEDFTAQGKAYFPVDRKTQSAVVRQLEIIAMIEHDLPALRSDVRRILMTGFDGSGGAG